MYKYVCVCVCVCVCVPCVVCVVCVYVFVVSLPGALLGECFFQLSERSSVVRSLSTLECSHLIAHFIECASMYVSPSMSLILAGKQVDYRVF